jgi:hypothetical protein
MDQNKKNASGKRKWLLVLIFLLPALLMIGKLSALPSSDFLRHWLSLAHLPLLPAHRLQYVLFVPLGAAVVVFFRQTLGVRLLGPFRSILIAVAFQITGIMPGLLFLVLIISIIVAIRPLIKTLRLPYFARISTMLSAVSLVMLLVILCCEWLGLTLVEGVAYFPIVVICLTAEGFARTLLKEGWGSALWRGGMTAFVAVLITLISQISQVSKLLMEFPELLLTQVGLIVLIPHCLDLRLLEKLNPPRKKRKRAKVAKPRPDAASADAARAESRDEAEEQIQTL